jgi:arylsulfatase A-like enzyme
MQKPNILYIHSHDTGRYIQPFGYRFDTPNMQQLAEDGILFRQCHCTNPTCSPSRASLVTGTYPHQNGMFGLAHIGWRLNDYGEHIVHILREHGYHSVLSGIQHITGHHETPEIGYDEWLNPDGPAPHVAAVEWLENKASPRQPFFLSVGFGETHRAFPEDHPLDDARYTMPPEPMPDTPRTREDTARYAGYVRKLDAQMGEVFDALKRNGMWENTLVICTTDHGIAFPRMKCTLTDAGTGVLLIMQGPGGFEGGKVVDGMVSHLDIYPTICDLVGIEKPERLEGVSLLPVTGDPTAELREEVHGSVNYHSAYEPRRSVRTRRYKYIRRFSERTRPVMPNVDDSLSKAVWVEAGWPKVEHEMLFDLLLDPNESRNLVDDADYREVLQEMRDRLRRWQERTDDPILKGPIPPADGTVYCDIDADGEHAPHAPFSEHPQY